MLRQRLGNWLGWPFSDTNRLCLKGQTTYSNFLKSRIKRQSLKRKISSLVGMTLTEIATRCSIIKLGSLIWLIKLKTSITQVKLIWECLKLKQSKQGVLVEGDLRRLQIIWYRKQTLSVLTIILGLSKCNHQTLIKESRTLETIWKLTPLNLNREILIYCSQINLHPLIIASSSFLKAQELFLKTRAKISQWKRDSKTQKLKWETNLMITEVQERWVPQNYLQKNNNNLRT